MTKLPPNFVAHVDDVELPVQAPPKPRRRRSRKAGPPDWEHPLRRMLLEEMEITIDGKRTKLPVYMVWIRVLNANAQKGCRKSRKVLAAASGGFGALIAEQERRNRLEVLAYAERVRDAARSWTVGARQDGPT